MNIMIEIIDIHLNTESGSVLKYLTMFLNFSEFGFNDNYTVTSIPIIIILIIICIMTIILHIKYGRSNIVII